MPILGTGGRFDAIVSIKTSIEAYLSQMKKKSTMNYQIK
ncbi:MAG: hypothetical protein K0Q56_1535 [Sporolactobacillus laevolacticus]|uniref:Uncharacterized protein n=1 Tax=Sporolactobacillus laevolacticus DSM 442 TaxID=1395513 RepID=V6J033_9BACL|nr:hypothetical protein P343_02650 [Sporolactobacillus laevolacticus DSM 442]MDF2910654.1 hypothetical protein [Sporolactobacillus laevolacticus]